MADLAYILPDASEIGRAKHSRRDCPSLRLAIDLREVPVASVPHLSPCRRCAMHWYHEWHEWMDTHDPVWIELARRELAQQGGQ